jgi:tetratricopeptide (TPR) repeat protein
MKRPSLIAGGSVNQRLRAAEAAWQCKDFQVCLEILQGASRLAPANTDILLQLGQLQGSRYDYAAAGDYFGRALRLAPHKYEMLMAITDRCHTFRNPDIFERHLRLALEQPDVTPQAYIKLAELYERLRRLPEAAHFVERALALNPTDPGALLVRARLERLAGRLESAEQVLRSFISKPIPDTWIHARSWYELANVLDRQGRFDDAMTAFLEAKILLRPQAPPYLADGKLFLSRLKVMQSHVSATLLGQWFNEAPTMDPPRRLALLCGYARSGTTLLEQVLDAHPDIISAEETPVFLEDAFFPLKRRLPPDALMLPVLESADLRALQQARIAYFHAMELCLGQPLQSRLLLDKNPDHTGIIPAFIRIFPESKFLIAMRDPRDVVLSCFMQAQPLNGFTAADLSLAGGTERYADIMSVWRTLEPLLAGHYHEVRYENLVEDLESVAHDTLDFLGVPWNDRVLGFDEHARKKMVRSPTYADVTQPIYKRSCGRWRNYDKYLEPHLEKLEPFVKAFSYE